MGRISKKSEKIKVITEERRDRLKKPLTLKPLELLPEPPRFLDETGKSVFKKVGEILINHKKLTEADIEALIAYSQAYSLAVSAYKDIKKNGTTIRTKSGYEQIRPAVTVWRNANDQMRKWATELGLTLLSRHKLQIEPIEEEGLDDILL